MPTTEAQYGPPTLANIAKGALEKKLNERLQDTARRLAAYVEGAGIDMTKGAKAEITLKITMKHVEAGVFTVKGDVSDKAPSTPLPATDRLVLDDGQLLMPLSDALTEDDDPRQMALPMDPNRTKDL